MRYSMYLYSFKIRRMDTFFRTTVCALAAALLLLAACDKKPGRDAVPAVAPSQADQEIALEIYALIPQTDLPDYCRNLSQDKDETAGDPRNFTAQVQGYDLGLEAGFNGLFTLHCYPLSAGGWRAFWIASAGMEGLLGFDRAGAYNYVDGKLTPEEDWTLPLPSPWDMIDFNEGNLPVEECFSIAETPFYTYEFGDEGLYVTIDIDYLLDEEDVILPKVETWRYDWNGKRLVLVDAHGEPVRDVLDCIDMRIIARELCAGKAKDCVFIGNGFTGPDSEEEDVFSVRGYPREDGGWRVAQIGSQRNVLHLFDYKDGKLVSLPKERFDELVGQVLWANEGAYLELEEDAVTVAEVNALGNQEILARFPWNGRNFGDL